MPSSRRRLGRSTLLWKKHSVVGLFINGGCNMFCWVTFWSLDCASKERRRDGSASCRWIRRTAVGKQRAMMTAGVVQVAIEKGVAAQPSIRSRPHTLPCAGGTFHSFVAAGGGYGGEGDGRLKEPY
ncbi:ras-related protein RABH1b [Iris pallida]|uniref:Ras-related protein RABH1b n=1 Tax=Iris pallida TaxID=29817 RepID=A0AAX6HSH7_IRIPA|nr:ras-related protein RABH1b [Iris pallida]